MSAIVACSGEFWHVAQGLERRLDTAEVGGSIPPVPTTVESVAAGASAAVRNAVGPAGKECTAV